jgi:hypothetical protein
MTLPISFWRSLQDARALPFNLEFEINLSLVDGTPLLWSANGKLTPVVNQTDRCLFINQGPVTTGPYGSLVNLGSSPPVLNQIGSGYNAQAGPGGNQSVVSQGGYGDVVPVAAGGIWKTSFTPVVPAFVSSATGSPYSIICPTSPATYAANAFQGGTIYCQSTNQQFRITASSAVTSGNPLTFTIVPPIGAVGATRNADGLTFTATPLGPALSSIKWSNAAGTVASSGYVPSQLGVGSADYSGGFLTIHDVDLQNQFVFLIFQ